MVEEIRELEGWGWGRKTIIQFYNTNGTEKYSITVLFTIYYLIPKKTKKLFQVLYNTI